MGKRPSPTLIGIFVVGAVTLVVAALMLLGAGRLFARRLPFVLFFDGSVNGLEVGAQVKFRGVPVGRVTDVRLGAPGVEPSEQSYRIPVFIEIDQDRAAGLGARGILDDPNRAIKLVEQGLRAQLQLQSIITGVLYIGLDILPDTPITLTLPPNSGYDEIPTVPTAFEQAQAKILEVVDHVAEIDFPALERSLRGALNGVNKLVSSPETHDVIVSARKALDEIHAVAHDLKPRIAKLTDGVNGTTDQARESLKRLDGAVDSLKRVLDPQAPLVQNLSATLVDVSEAARSIRSLLDYLDRNPNALLTGRKGK